jgi:imidazole glycerol-phosphate synthase subunit HisH
MPALVRVLDYGVGNLHSLVKGLVAAGADVEVVTDPVESLQGTAMVLPGVGAFEPAAEVIAPERWALQRAISDGYPVLGICLGMQLLFDTSDEGPGFGIGAILGRVTRLNARSVPQIGWNTVEGPDELLAMESGLREAYYANSFVCRPEDESVVTAWTTHEGDRFPAVVRYRNVIGAQFHPEKSSAQGLAFLRGWVESLPGGRNG